MNVYTDKLFERPNGKLVATRENGLPKKTGYKYAAVVLERLAGETDEQLYDRAVAELDKFDLSDDEAIPWRHE